MAIHSFQSRRSFMSALTSLAGVAAINAAGREAAVQAPPATAQTWDLRWMDELKAA